MVRARKLGHIPNPELPGVRKKKQSPLQSVAKPVGGQITPGEIRKVLEGERRAELERLKKLVPAEASKLRKLEFRIGELDFMLRQSKSAQESAQIMALKIQLLEEVSSIHHKVNAKRKSVRF